MPTKEIRGPHALQAAYWTCEADFEDAVIAFAQAHGWLVHATRVAPSGKGWRTPVKGDTGFVDLVLARDGTRHHWELKWKKGTPEPEQRVWLTALDGRCYWETDWDYIREVLQ